MANSVIDIVNTGSVIQNFFLLGILKKIDNITLFQDGVTSPVTSGSVGRPPNQDSTPQ